MIHLWTRRARVHGRTSVHLYRQHLHQFNNDIEKQNRPTDMFLVLRDKFTVITATTQSFQVNSKRFAQFYLDAFHVAEITYIH